MNLWRVPIDERSGRPRGAPQQITAPAPSGVLPSLSRDGRHIAFATEIRKSNLLLVGFDPLSRSAVGPLKPATQGSRVVRSGEISPDGEQVVFDTAEPQEDLFLARTDGSEVRPLTADAAKDRGPHWSRDGRRLLFFSDRGGRYEAWALDVATGARERLTALAEGVLDPLGSPDGRSLLYTRAGSGLALVDLTLPLSERRPRPLPVDGQPPAVFVATSWSADGDWLAGYDEGLHIVLYSFAARRYQTLPELGEEVMWLRDGRTLLFLRDGALWALERSGGGLAGPARKLLDPPPGLAFSRLSIGPGDRSLALVAGMDEGNIGMLTLQGALY
jgi:Tol biopolymer transport system component